MSLEVLSRFTYPYMRRFALGCLGYSPGRFGLIKVGDFLDAMAGFNEQEFERTKILAELIRTSVTKLWNMEVIRGHGKVPEEELTPQQLMPFPWDKKPEPVEISNEERQRTEKIFERILNGDSNNKP